MVELIHEDLPIRAARAIRVVGLTRGVLPIHVVGLTRGALPTRAAPATPAVRRRVPMTTGTGAKTTGRTPAGTGCVTERSTI